MHCKKVKCILYTLIQDKLFYCHGDITCILEYIKFCYIHSNIPKYMSLR